ncbi:hypothetical protein TanjilG_18086 [Lupinus angustifolius]|uniref:Dof zinc finger protein n=1 Tax=Lupinus angustifolius TaxID=3871 RepID=A0A1J7HAX1_LUPAN|nr:PREDICTED: dof zinc finger protein DOF3.4-like [Lupinus angustifolius]OIW09756.1 hypothetical protein TanjilG_18086 [Lupinus angustifolius]
MPSMDSGSATKPPSNHVSGGRLPPQGQEYLQCPRCDSTNTKFCYYNNYNLSQPRHFCKSCRRYWTQGGTLRDIPVGGGSRKNAKRSRTLHNYNVSNSTSSSSTMTSSAMVVVPNQAGPMSMSIENLNVNVCSGEIRSFSSLLNNTQGSSASGFLALGGFGLGLEEIEFRVGRAGWSFPGTVAGAANFSGDVAASGGGAWQLEGGEASYVGGRDYFSWPGLAISTPENGLK